MIEKWFNDTVDKLMEKHHRLVITDTEGKGAFMLRFLPSGRYMVLTASTEMEELFNRLEAEREYRDRDVVFYTCIPRSRLTALMEYAKTCGCIVLDDMEAYLKRMLYRHLGVNSHVDGKTLLLAAKTGIGKNENWWRSIAQGISSPVSPQNLLVYFLKNPVRYERDTDKDVVAIMKEEACKLTGKPNTKQKPETLAKEVMQSLFGGLLKGKVSKPMLEIYETMTDSESMREALQNYIDSYDIPANCNPVKAHPDHPFMELDRRVFRLLSDNLRLGTPTDDILRYIERRTSSAKAGRFKAKWLKEVKTLLNFDIGHPNLATTLDEMAAYYQKTFALLDTAMRRIYAEWLNEPENLRPIQELYEQFNKVLMQCWFPLADHYQPTQQGILPSLFAKSMAKTAVIVCDGLRLEMAESIAKRKFPKGTTIDRRTAWSKLPSVTVNGMSALYGLPSPNDDSVSKRYVALKEAVADVEILSLSMLNKSITAHHLLLTYGDIDKIGETKQLSGLRDIAAYEQTLYEKIRELQLMGYERVCITTDHGYVITGILDEADKIPVPAGASAEERFLVSDTQLTAPDLIERNDDWLKGCFQYYAKTDKPFRTKGQYGYAHGGMTLQECLIPVYCFLLHQQQKCMKVSILNKEELKSVTGQFYTIKLGGTGSSDNLFEAERKVKMLFFDKNGAGCGQTNILKVRSDRRTETEFEMSGNYQKVVVVDAMTTEQLDSAEILKSTSRDLDDLF